MEFDVPSLFYSAFNGLSNCLSLVLGELVSHCPRTHTHLAHNISYVACLQFPRLRVFSLTTSDLDILPGRSSAGTLWRCSSRVSSGLPTSDGEFFTLLYYFLTVSPLHEVSGSLVLYCVGSLPIHYD